MDITTPVPATATPAAVQEKTSKPWETAKEIKGVARTVLGGHSGGLSHRLTLTLSVILLITVSIALYAAVACLALAGEFALGDALWIDAVANCLLAALELGWLTRWSYPWDACPASWPPPTGRSPTAWPCRCPPPT